MHSLNLFKARQNFESEQNKEFDLRKYRQSSIRKVYDSLHGISNDSVCIDEAIEIMAYCLDDGKIDQESEFETELYNSLLQQLEKMKNDISDETLALIWIYLQTVGKPVESLLMKRGLWNFDKRDFKSAILTVTWDEVIENDKVILTIKRLIVNRLKSQNQYPVKWLKDLYNEVGIDYF